MTGHLVPGRFVIVTNSVSLARQLWRYGEPELAERVADLAVEEVADLGIRAAALADAGEPERLWPAGPGFSNGAQVLASIERLEGVLRPPRRNRRRPEKSLPAKWQVPEDVLWTLTAAVGTEIDRRRSRPTTAG